MSRRPRAGPKIANNTVRSQQSHVLIHFVTDRAYYKHTKLCVLLADNLEIAFSSSL